MNLIRQFLRIKQSLGLSLYHRKIYKIIIRISYQIENLKMEIMALMNFMFETGMRSINNVKNFHERHQYKDYKEKGQ
jgi:hypothetical protein